MNSFKNKIERISIMGVPISNLSNEETVDLLTERVTNNKKTIIYTPNTEIVMMCQKNEKLSSIIRQGDLVLPDGIGLVVGSKLKRVPLKERVTGVDTSLALVEVAKKHNKKVFLLGGKPGVAELAMKKLNESHEGIVVGCHHGYFKGVHLGAPGDGEEAVVIEQINRSGADILFVGLGSPNQEQWIYSNQSLVNTNTIIGNGGTIDVLSGQVRRAPVVFQKIGLEWLYRLVKDPKRIKRQIMLPEFIIKIMFGSKDIVRKLKKD